MCRRPPCSAASHPCQILRPRRPASTGGVSCYVVTLSTVVGGSQQNAMTAPCVLPSASVGAVAPGRYALVRISTGTSTSVDCSSVWATLCRPPDPMKCRPPCQPLPRLMWTPVGPIDASMSFTWVAHFHTSAVSMYELRPHAGSSHANSAMQRQGKSPPCKVNGMTCLRQLPPTHNKALRQSRRRLAHRMK